MKQDFNMITTFLTFHLQKHFSSFFNGFQLPEIVLDLALGLQKIYRSLTL